ncbi:MAG: helix-turn-helix domain-containing protein [Muribaculaceae bacterium]|nr:helix-turn-helix domain-containing protein [Muribaculaceae bacterium]
MNKIILGKYSYKYINTFKYLRYLKVFMFIICILYTNLPVIASKTLESLSAEDLKNKGNTYLKDNQYIKALTVYTEAMKKAVREKNSNIESESINNIGTIYAVFKDYETSVRYFEKAFKLAKERHDNRLMTISAINLVSACVSLCKIADAEYYANVIDSLSYFPMLTPFYHEYHSGQIATAKKRYAEAISFYRQALRISDRDKLNSSLKVCQDMAKVFKSYAETDSALKYYRRVIEMSLRQNLFEETCDAYLDMAELYRLNGNIDSVAKCQESYIVLADSLFNIRNFNTAKSELIEYENQYQEIRMMRQRFWTIGLGIIAGIVVICLIITHYYYGKLRVSRMILVKTNEELLRSINQKASQLSSSVIFPMETKSPEELRRQRLVNDIRNALNDTKLICDPNFSLQILASHINSNTKYVSAAINEEFNMNFKTLLNERRIQEVCRMMMDNDKYGNYTISAIAQEAGYNSMNSFITAFKRLMGMTPSKYRELSLQSNEIKSE